MIQLYKKGTHPNRLGIVVGAFISAAGSPAHAVDTSKVELHRIWFRAFCYLVTLPRSRPPRTAGALPVGVYTARTPHSDVHRTPYARRRRG